MRATFYGHALLAAATVSASSLEVNDWLPSSLQSQHPLGSDFQVLEIPPLGKFTKLPVVEEACPSQGESQWTGLLSISEGRSIYYWYFDSRNDPENDPIIIWMNGGPGASSMAGIFTEVGPCFLPAGQTNAEPNPWSWNNNASIVFLDQPAGMGFSHLDPLQPIASTEHETAKDFEMFLNMFFDDVFPDKKHLPIHIATESYGGHYGPVYLDHIVQSRKNGADSAFRGNITSLVLVSPIIDWTSLAIGAYHLLCEDSNNADILDTVSCRDMARSIPEQKRLGRLCNDAYGGEPCREAYNHAQGTIHAPYLDLVNANKKYIGDFTKSCEPNRRFPHCTDPDMGNYTAYVNQEWVKKALSKPAGVFFSPFSKKMYEAFHNSSAFMAPTTRELANVLDSGDTRVLVLSGERDYLANSPGTMQIFEDLEWTGQEEYKGAEWYELPKNVAPGSWKATRDGHLAFVALDKAGHMLPRDEREGSFRIMQTWMEGWTT